MNYFVSVIRADSSQGQLYGPFEYEEAERVLIAALKKGNNDNGPVVWDAEAQATVDDLGYYTFEGGGGIFVCQSEPYPEDGVEGYSVEDGALYHTKYPGEILGEFQDGRFVPSRYLLELPNDPDGLFTVQTDEWATNWYAENC